ncbi:MAG: ATP-binding cassette domain-containing protein [Eubacteriales bacterium]|nr:ATP-binding cassette domain-containing protein [Eubacteriales bacterium]
MEPSIQLTDIIKIFNHVVALNRANLSAYPGEVLAIVGDNGAGKSTLIKMLTGELQPDSGKIRIGGQTYRALHIKEALSLGVFAVYQDLALGGTMDVTSNIFLGNEIRKHGFLDRKTMKKEAEALIRELDINIPDLRTPVSDLSGGQKQGVAVARLIKRGGRYLIFDEPTAAMGLMEADRTLKLIRNLADKGMTVLIICHNLMQVYQIADRIAVIRHGQIIREDRADQISQKDIIAILSSADMPANTEGGKD